MKNIFKKLYNAKQCMAFFIKLKINYLSKMRGYPQFSFWIPRVLTKIFKPHKNITVSVSITDRKSEYLEMRRTYVQ